ncbi:universal stress protein [Anaeromyxobacter diazotrophicus]|uniref:Universal stress protein A n=1 Tax=Anaeromyxobacter diazotrophicus TaxID=2590199 RepID=A0A7I9VR40_9BACT|nr:universal stress protein [Anaeromyxobacter diazotrophicus]GEJ58875.1 universal stress protein A [Anaeromyxobacter diazotrophicus]
MALKELLVHVDSGARTTERRDLAFLLARRFGAQVSGWFAENEALGASLVGRRGRSDMDRAAEAARLAFEASARAAGLEAGWWRLEPGEPRHLIDHTTIRCRYTDLAIFGQHDDRESWVPEELVEEVVVGCGRPALVVPAFGRFPDVGKRVVVAWDGSREAARALHDGLPLMREAQSVTLLAFQRPSAGPPGPLPHLDVAAHLAAHGVTARYERVFVGELGPTDTLLNRCAEVGADLIVMGARPQRGLPLQDGGSLRELLRQMTAPVLLSH